VLQTKCHIAFEHSKQTDQTDQTSRARRHSLPVRVCSLGMAMHTQDSDDI